MGKTQEEENAWKIDQNWGEGKVDQKPNPVFPVASLGFQVLLCLKTSFDHLWNGCTMAIPVSLARNPPSPNYEEGSFSGTSGSLIKWESGLIHSFNPHTASFQQGSDGWNRQHGSFSPQKGWERSHQLWEHALYILYAIVFFAFGTNSERKLKCREENKYICYFLERITL